jgi:hypothetical protein
MSASVLEPVSVPTPDVPESNPEPESVDPPTEVEMSKEVPVKPAKKETKKTTKKAEA